MRTITEIFHSSEEKFRQQKALLKMLLQCRDASVYYRRAADRAEDICSRNLLVDMVNIKAETVDLLKSLTRTEPRLVGKDAFEKVATAALGSDVPGYLGIATSVRNVDEFSNCPISVELLEIEGQALERMRRGLRDVKNRKLLRQLSSKLATMQIVSDQMKLLNGIRI